MSWVRLIAEVSDRQAEALSDALLACGALSASIEQNLGSGRSETEVFGEPGEPPPALWPECLVDALLPAGSDPHAVMQAACLHAGFTEIPAYQSDTVADQDWVSLTQRQFDPIPAAPGLWIVPTWHEPPDPSALNIRLDPGQAFGTGSHPTTRLCLQQLVREAPRGQHILDYGCGSGILAIAARLLGARQVAGVDIDPAAIATARANAQRNGVEAEFFLPDVLAPCAQFDGVVANILASPLVVLAPLLLAYLKPGGWIALSGILERQADQVIAAYQPGCRLAVTAQAEGWVCLSGQKG
ncbi:MAG: 50S ribosomal protein L11 methyltransferase [Betaproteobacteria bacterium]|nr:50S ribosomal protein L11 methyltransferase [Betaproteobacteria bacterium]MDE2131889.1 50S ribosomal protein L11 methyltransferase [Betaproteobacteria bacterium]MDE2212223.1 50S ribosomal protein L11 methyltransferase [Betaproteobacteria bacterium]